MTMDLQQIKEVLCESLNNTNHAEVSEAIDHCIDSLDNLQGKYLLITRSSIKETK